MTHLEAFLYPTQKELFRKLQKLYWEKAIGKTMGKKGKFLLVTGEVPVLLIAHLDTVHRNPVKTICRSGDGNLLMSPQGIGGDDRCGVYGIAKIYRLSERKPWLLFTCDEETGGKGANAFCTAYRGNDLPKQLEDLKMLIELDRKGRNEAVYYGCANPDFEAYITSKGFKTDLGTFSDISIIAPELGVAAVNLACGYYNAHTAHEYICREHLEATVQKVMEMVSDAAREGFQRYEYREAEWGAGCDHWGTLYDGWDGHEDWRDVEIPQGLPQAYRSAYEELLDIYDPDELACFCQKYGARGIRELYAGIFGPL